MIDEKSYPFVILENAIEVPVTVTNKREPGSVDFRMDGEPMNPVYMPQGKAMPRTDVTAAMRAFYGGGWMLVVFTFAAGLALLAKWRRKRRA